MDDDDLVRPTISSILSILSFNVREASRGKDALKLLSEEHFDLILTDLFMPEINGLELVITIRKLMPKTPIVLMTGGGLHFPKGSGGLHDLTSSAEFLGASFVLQKPFKREDLAKVLTSVFPP